MMDASELFVQPESQRSWHEAVWKTGEQDHDGGAEPILSPYRSQIKKALALSVCWKLSQCAQSHHLTHSWGPDSRPSRQLGPRRQPGQLCGVVVTLQCQLEQAGCVI